MAKVDTEWKVQRHAPLTKLDEGLWIVQGDVPGMALKRVMTIVRRENGELVIHNPIALEESAMKELEALGRVATIVTPNAFHRIDTPRFKARYPDAKVVTPSGAKKKVGQVVVVDVTYEEAAADSRVSFRPLAGVKDAEGVMVVSTAEGTTLVFNDALFNAPHVGGFGGFMLRYVTNSTGGLRVSGLFRLAMLKDKKAFRADLEALAATPKLRRIVVGHHQTVEQDAARALADVAKTL